jgi:hypothetical protein
MADPGTSRTLTLTTGGITLLGVLVSLGVTVAFGIKADWWIRILAGMATTALLVAVVKLGTSAGRGRPRRQARACSWAPESALGRACLRGATC